MRLIKRPRTAAALAIICLAYFLYPLFTDHLSGGPLFLLFYPYWFFRFFVANLTVVYLVHFVCALLLWYAFYGFTWLMSLMVSRVSR